MVSPYISLSMLVLRTLMRRYALPSDTQDSININGLELDTFIGVPDEERASMQLSLIHI